MSSQSSKKNIKFSIDGDIQTPRESSYLKEVDKEKAGRYKRLSIIFITLFIMTLALAIFQYLVLQQKVQELEEHKIANSETNLQVKVDELSKLNDSLSLSIAKLQLTNDLLSENFDPGSGIFFEVHMDFEGDFDLDQYHQELAKTVSKEFDGREKLVLGRFRSFKKALLFENDLKKMGAKNLFLLGRVDGKIMTFKEALAIAQNENK